MLICRMMARSSKVQKTPISLYLPVEDNPDEYKGSAGMVKCFGTLNMPLINIFIITILGGGIYFGCLYLFGGFSLADIESVAKSFKRGKDAAQAAPVIETNI